MQQLEQDKEAVHKHIYNHEMKANIGTKTLDAASLQSLTRMIMCKDNM